MHSELFWISGKFLLGIIQSLPAIMGGVIFLIRDPRSAFRLGLATAFFELGLSVILYEKFINLPSDEGTFYFNERLSLWGALAYHTGVDGFTVLFIFLSAFLSLMVLIYGAEVRRFSPLPLFIAVALWSEALLMSQFATIDLLWFGLSATLQVPLMGFLLSYWATSGSQEGAAVTRYYQFMGIGILLLGGAILMLGWIHADATHGTWRFDLIALSQISFSSWQQSIIFYLLFYGLAIRVPLFPLHGWLPDVAEHGTVASAMLLLLGVKSGIYGMLRYLFPLTPDAVWQWHGYVVAFSLIAIFYAATLALSQRNIRRLLAYAVVSHTGVLVIGLFSLSSQGFQSGALLAVNFGLAISALLLMVGSVYVRTRSLLLNRLGGLAKQMPLVAAAFLVATLAIIGMPLTPGFDAVHLMLEAALERFGAAVPIAAAVGNITAAACLLLAFQRAFLGALGDPHLSAEGGIEKTIAIIMIVVQLAAGFYSRPLFNLVEKPAARLADIYHSAPVK